MEFITLIIVISLFWIWGVVCGWRAREEHARKRLDNFVKYMEAHQEEELAESMIPITIEKVDGVFYVYNGEDQTFMAQGKTRRDLEDALDKRYPGKKFAALPSNLREVGL